MRLRDFEFRTDVPGMYAVPGREPAVTIYMAAEGGGTVGEAYAGQRWHYAVAVNGRAVLAGSDLRSNCTPGTHASMARTLANFLAAAGESLHWSRDRSEYADEYPGRVREFLEAEYERLGMFADTPAELGAE